VRGLLKCRTSTARFRSAAANAAPPIAGCLAKTKFALDGRTANPSLISSRVIASRPAMTVAPLVALAAPVQLTPLLELLAEEAAAVMALAHLAKELMAVQIVT